MLRVFGKPNNFAMRCAERVFVSLTCLRVISGARIKLHKLLLMQIAMDSQMFYSLSNPISASVTWGYFKGARMKASIRLHTLSVFQTFRVGNLSMRCCTVHPLYLGKYWTAERILSSESLPLAVSMR